MQPPFFLINKARMMPPQSPMAIRKSDPKVKRPKGFLYDLFRVEFVTSFAETALSSDAFSGFGRVGHPMEERKIIAADQVLRQVVIPAAACDLAQQYNGLEVDLDIGGFLHRHGINLRFIGLVRQEVKKIRIQEGGMNGHMDKEDVATDALVMTLAGEMVARSAKHILRSRLRECRSFGDRRKVVVPFFNDLLFGGDKETKKTSPRNRKTKWGGSSNSRSNNNSTKKHEKIGKTSSSSLAKNNSVIGRLSSATKSSLLKMKTKVSKVLRTTPPKKTRSPSRKSKALSPRKALPLPPPSGDPVDDAVHHESTTKSTTNSTTLPNNATARVKTKSPERRPKTKVELAEARDLERIANRTKKRTKTRLPPPPVAPTTTSDLRYHQLLNNSTDSASSSIPLPPAKTTPRKSHLPTLTIVSRDLKIRRGFRNNNKNSTTTDRFLFV